QVVPQVAARDQQVGERIGPVFGQPEADVLVRVRAAGLDFVEQLFRPLDLFLPAGRRGVAGLLLGQFLQGWALELAHRNPPGCRVASLAVARRGSRPVTPMPSYR